MARGENGTWISCCLRGQAAVSTDARARTLRYLRRAAAVTLHRIKRVRGKQHGAAAYAGFPDATAAFGRAAGRATASPQRLKCWARAGPMSAPRCETGAFPRLRVSAIAGDC
jgi:hypothetical protein